MSAPKITLYTNHGCPWAHRAHIALNELGLEFKEVIIDLDVPREEWYLKINPRGLVPTIDYNGEIIPESGIVAQFLADAHPSHLQKTSSEEGGALQRARVNFFVDAFVSKLIGQLFAGARATSETEKAEAADKLVAVVAKELEPSLQDAAPFFGGSKKLTLAEVQTGSFLLRLFTMTKYGLLNAETLTKLEAQTPKFYAWANATVKEHSVNFIYDEEKVAERTKERFAKVAAVSKV